MAEHCLDDKEHGELNHSAQLLQCEFRKVNLI